MSVDINNIISENFDKIMSKDIPFTTNINDIKDNIVCNNNKCDIKKPINKPVNKLINKSVNINKPINKPINKLININKPINKFINKPEKNPLYDISKKSLLGSLIYFILSLPILLNGLNKILPNSESNIYKGIIFRSIIFSILFVLLSKYI
jgi:hypothetical protein